MTVEVPASEWVHPAAALLAPDACQSGVEEALRERVRSLEHLVALERSRAAAAAHAQQRTQEELQEFKKAHQDAAVLALGEQRRMQEECEASAEAQSQQLQVKIDALSQQVAVLQQDLEAANTRVSRESARCATLESQLDDLREDTLGHQRNRDRAEHRAIEAREVAVRLELQLAALQANVHESRRSADRIRQLEDALAESEQKLRREARATLTAEESLRIAATTGRSDLAAAHAAAARHANEMEARLRVAEAAAAAHQQRAGREAALAAILQHQVRAASSRLESGTRDVLSESFQDAKPFVPNNRGGMQDMPRDVSPVEHATLF